LSDKLLLFHYKMNIEITEAKSREELKEILLLQEKNHRDTLSNLEDGFVSLKHELPLLEKMNVVTPQIIAKAENKVVAFALVMPVAFKKDVPVLLPLFEMLENVSYKGKKIVDYSYYVMGQICVDEAYRGMGIFDRLYAKHKEIYSNQFDICVTEIASRNKRSMKAHQRVGFEIVHTFQDKLDEWNIVVWDWK
jgi:ribosomal protein S18 acetylase RimI-like enzyme